MHTVAALSVCIRDGRMTRAEARHLVLKIAALEFQDNDFFDTQA